MYSLALRNVNVKAGSFLKTTAAAPASQSITGTGFAPSAVFFHSFQDVTQAAPVAQSRMSYGASDGVTEGSSAFSDLDGRRPDEFSGHRQDQQGVHEGQQLDAGRSTPRPT